MDDSIKNFKKAGGKIFVAKIQVTNVGWIAICFDTSGNPIDLWQDLPAPPKKSVRKKE